MREMIAAIPVLVLLGPIAEAQIQGRDSPIQTPTQLPQAAGTRVTPQAPVGHRQPTQGTLPPDVRKDEDTTGRGVVDQLGPIPQICKNC